jgi:hypothetical protein
MAKKKNESADEIIDSLAKDVGASDEPKSKPGPKKPAADAHVETMSQMFMTSGGEMKEDAAVLMERFVDPGARKRGATNLFVFLILIVAVGGGFYLLAKLSSHEAREERIAKKLAIEEAHMKEQIAKLKRFGNLRIETTPPGAVIIQDKDPNKCVKPNAATGQSEPCLSPLDISNLDISQTYEFDIAMPNHEPYNFKVAEHLWTKQQGAEDYSFFTMVELIPNACEFWFAYDGKLKKEVQFKGETGQADCKKYKDEATKKGSTVTDCTCKVLPPGTPSAPPK